MNDSRSENPPASLESENPLCLQAKNKQRTGCERLLRSISLVIIAGTKRRMYGTNSCHNCVMFAATHEARIANGLLNDLRLWRLWPPNVEAVFVPCLL